MKTVKELLEANRKFEEEQTLSEAYGADHLSKADVSHRPMGFVRGDRDVPTVLVLKRKAIRVYPDNQKVALYYSQQLDQYISVPFGPNAKNFGNAMGLMEKKEDSDNEYITPAMRAVMKSIDKEKNAENAYAKIADYSSDFGTASDKNLTKAAIKKTREGRGSTAWKLGRETKQRVLRGIAVLARVKSPLQKDYHKDSIRTEPAVVKSSEPKGPVSK